MIFLAKPDPPCQNLTTYTMSNASWDDIKNFIFSVNFILKFFIRNIYKFYYEKNLQKIIINFFIKYFV